MTESTEHHFRLRPLSAEDLELIRAWRNSDRVRTMMCTDTLITEEGQRAWFAGLAGDATRAWHIFEVDGKTAGVVYFSPIDRANARGSWGFYMGDTVVPLGSAVQMGRLGLTLAFEQMGLREVIGEVLAFNEKSLRFHDRLGFRRAEVIPGREIKNGKPCDVVRFLMDRDMWARLKDAT